MVTFKGHACGHVFKQRLMFNKDVNTLFCYSIFDETNEAKVLALVLVNSTLPESLVVLFCFTVAFVMHCSRSLSSPFRTLSLTNLPRRAETRP